MIRTALITGGTSGLGLECARELLDSATSEWQVVITSRDPAAHQKTLETLNNRARAGSVKCYPLDLGSKQSIRAFAASIAGTGNPIDALVCNAGVQFTSDTHRTADGFEATFGTNHLGHFLLVHLLARRLAPNANIVIVSSGTHDPALKTGIPPPKFLPDIESLAYPERDESHRFQAEDSPRVAGQRRYSTSKLCNIYFAYELHSRLRSKKATEGIAVNAFNPGLMPGTGLARDYPPVQQFAFRHVLPHLIPVLRVFMGTNVHSAEESGAALAALAAESAKDRPSGVYFDGRKQVRSSLESYDLTNRRALWMASESFAGIDSTERI
jgi:NAD(P)-dependent dehydrogenase (short-subunit alcohol dehydrogenase family)